jgi:hypothetical protein
MAALPRSTTGEVPPTGAGSDLLVDSPQLWSDPVDGGALITDIETIISAHAVLPEGATVAMAIWILHTYGLSAAAITPRLAILSPTKRCGKTTVLKLLGALAQAACCSEPHARGALPCRRGVRADDPPVACA